MSIIFTPKSKSIKCVDIQGDNLFITYRKSSKKYHFWIDPNYAIFLINEIQINNGKNLNSKYIYPNLNRNIRKKI